MGKRTITIGALLVGLMLITGAAIATVGRSFASTSTSTSVPDDSPNTSAPDSTSTSLPGSSTSTSLPDSPTTTLPSGAAASSAVYQAGAAGSVTVARDGTTLFVTSVDPNSGWSFEIEQASGAEVEVKFLSGDHRIDLEAELEHGEVRVRVRDRAGDDNRGPGNGDDGDDNSGPGNGDDAGDDNSGPGNDGDDNSGPGNGDDDDHDDDHGGDDDSRG
jgi:hypothetical protein